MSDHDAIEAAVGLGCLTMIALAPCVVITIVVLLWKWILT